MGFVRLEYEVDKYSKGLVVPFPKFLPTINYLSKAADISPKCFIQITYLQIYIRNLE
tara:strand:+ start:2055 stop:2225 length:171 start_codon:yes stop_codon:yes gene_type:complete